MIHSTSVSTRAIVLRLVPYRDSDRVVHLFTEEFGKVAAIARAARKSTRRFGGALQAFVVLHAELKLRPQAAMAELVSATPLKSFSTLAAQPLQLGRAGYLCELVDVLTRERDAAPELLDMLEQALGLCADREVVGAVLLRIYEVAVLNVLGWWPDCSRCQRCGTALNANEAVTLIDGTEGFVCTECHGPPISAPLRSVLTPGPLQRVRTLDLSREELLVAGRKTLTKIQALSPRKLKTLEFLRQLER